MEFWAEYGVETLLVLLCVGIVLLGFWLRRTAERLEEAQRRMMEWMVSTRSAEEEERARQNNALREAYDATNRMAAELVRSQQARLDAFSSQLAEGSANGGEQIAAVLEEIRRTGEALAQEARRAEQAQGVAEPPLTRAEIEPYFAALRQEMRRVEDAGNAKEGPAGLTREEAERLFAALREELRRVEGRPDPPAFTRAELEAYFDGLSGEMRQLSELLRAQADRSESTEVARVFERAQGEFKDFGEAIARTQKRLKQANKSMEEAARFSRRLQRHAHGPEEKGE